jgi:hypothetical protein
MLDFRFSYPDNYRDGRGFLQNIRMVFPDSDFGGLGFGSVRLYAIRLEIVGKKEKNFKKNYNHCFKE